MWRQVVAAGMASGVLLGPVGCKHCSKRRGSTLDADIPPPPGGFLGAPTAPPPGGVDRIPPPSLPTAPGGSLPPPAIPDRSTFRVDPAYPPPAGAVPPAGDLPPLSTLPPSSLPTTPAPSRSARPPKELLLPDAGLGDPAPPKYLDEPVRPPSAAKPSDPPPAAGSGDLPPPPAAMPNRSLPPAAPPGASGPPPASVSEKPPAGLSGYTAVPGKPGVYAGRRPALEGFDALKAAGFRTVVYVHDPATDVSAARELAEKQGLTFVPVPASPETLAKAVSAFNAAVNATANRPAYVCDEDGVRAGTLWYIHFRTADYLDDAPARIRATPLGFTEDGPAAREYLAAAREYLAGR